jgi:hypothetical protein
MIAENPAKFKSMEIFVALVLPGGGGVLWQRQYVSLSGIVRARTVEVLNYNDKLKCYYFACRDGVLKRQGVS